MFSNSYKKNLFNHWSMEGSYDHCASHKTIGPTPYWFSYKLKINFERKF